MTVNTSACERLVRSRERLFVAMRELAASPADKRRQPNGGGADPWPPNLRCGSGAGLLAEIAQSWWAKQPWRVVGMLGIEAAGLLLRPVAQRHPYALMGAAAATGAVVVLVRPWRWVSIPALLARVLPKVLAEIIRPGPVRP